MASDEINRAVSEVCHVMPYQSTANDQKAEVSADPSMQSSGSVSGEGDGVTNGVLPLLLLWRPNQSTCK